MVSLRKCLEHVARVFGRLAIIPLIAYQGMLLNNLVQDHHPKIKELYWFFLALDIFNCITFAGILAVRYEKVSVSVSVSVSGC